MHAPFLRLKGPRETEVLHCKGVPASHPASGTAVPVVEVMWVMVVFKGSFLPLGNLLVMLGTDGNHGVLGGTQAGRAEFCLRAVFWEDPCSWRRGCSGPALKGTGHGAAVPSEECQCGGEAGSST